ncbi:homeobox-leucine zipper protein hat14 [Phtheirospermum japonicum]|uniref:Homeobox-leucine zipper protein hat14 n=1 Tax=Phtheirospermum japonicum TaxID=374723 RepID=A0A830CD19_9LAMI|nr:homeobox-leucine zipper protein hat14 [Phtheirospermum japonicum]
MELGLSLGDPSKFIEKSSKKQKSSLKNGGLDFCMALSLQTQSVFGNEEREKKSQENDIIDDDSISVSGDNNNNNNSNQDLNLLPPSPVPRRLSLAPWSSDNGSSENGSSGNVDRAAATGLGVNRHRAAAEEVTSVNSVGSQFQLEFGVKRTSVGGKRDSEATGNDVVEKQKMTLAKQLNLRPRQVEVWFQNRRARTKMKQTEVDCAYLKRYCETLTEENQRLQKELQEVRALKNSNTFYMQLPATTLIMCPSCERVAAAAAPPPPSAAGSGEIGRTEVIPKAAPFPLVNGPKLFPYSAAS